MRAHKAFQYIHFIAVAIACASVMFRRPAQKRYLFRSSVQRHQVGINTVIDYPKPITWRYLLFEWLSGITIHNCSMENVVYTADLRYWWWTADKFLWQRERATDTADWSQRRDKYSKARPVVLAVTTFDDAKALIQAWVGKRDWCRNNRRYGSFAGYQHFYGRRSPVARELLGFVTVYFHAGAVRCKWRDIIQIIFHSAITVAAVVAL
jgi:hypothetical protein